MIKQSQDDKAQGLRIERYFVPHSIHISQTDGRSLALPAGVAQTWQRIWQISTQQNSNMH